MSIIPGAMHLLQYHFTMTSYEPKGFQNGGCIPVAGEGIIAMLVVFIHLGVYNNYNNKNVYRYAYPQNKHLL